MCVFPCLTVNLTVATQAWVRPSKVQSHNCARVCHEPTVVCLRSRIRQRTMSCCASSTFRGLNGRQVLAVCFSWPCCILSSAGSGRCRTSHLPPVFPPPGCLQLSVSPVAWNVRVQQFICAVQRVSLLLLHIEQSHCTFSSCW